jgi:hypothetical protein
MFSIALMVVVHLDTFALMARLNADSALRDKVVASAVSAMEKGQFAPPPAGGSVKEAQALVCARTHLASLGAARGFDAYADCMGLAEATKLELVSWLHDLAAWASRWQKFSFALLLQLLGMSLSISLLSLGAPFWYATLSKLRSTMSQKDEAARAERQTTQVG